MKPEYGKQVDVKQEGINQHYVKEENVKVEQPPEQFQNMVKKHQEELFQKDIKQECIIDEDEEIAQSSDPLVVKPIKTLWNCLACGKSAKGHLNNKSVLHI